MRSVTLTKLLATSLVTIGLLAGCAGSETKDEPVAETKPEVVEPKAEEVAPAQNEAAMEESNTTNSAADSTYEVVNGDNLWNISGKSEVYSDSYQWPLIYKANRDKIKDADLIYSGQTLDIDRSASQADMDAAISHAKTRGAWTLGTQEATDKAYLGE
ncbi:MAG: LysM peptidoglycan-binding domain-containing protein [Gammaproteobacteria bacterium]|nr:LysM peptidoglycan-binding domain-containing protein [Gammaproteobacteria bacterium]